MEIIPIFLNSNPEDDKIKCPKCGHEFELEDDESGWTILAIVGGIVMVFVLLFYVIDFLTGNQTLSEFIVSQKEGFISLIQRLKH